MNLVAKEFVAARSDEDGVLVLSKFAGASIELRDALIVNPYDIAGVSEALHRALEMDLSERRERMRHMRRQITEFNIYRWAARVLGDLRELRIEPTDAADPRATRSQTEPVEAPPHRKLA
jgi:trehalose 6-phosphate synthase